MEQKELEKWIISQRKEGFSDEEIRTVLRDKGVSNSKIKRAFSDINSSNQEYGKDIENNKGSFKTSQAEKSTVNDSASSYTELDIVEAVRNGLGFMKTRQAMLGFAYLSLAYILLLFTAIGVNFVGENGPILGVLGMAPLGLAFLASSVFLGYSYVKFFRIILRGVGMQLEPLGTGGTILTIIKLGVGFLIYFVAIFAGLIFLMFPGLYLAVVLFFWNYGLMQGKGLIHSFKQSFEITTGHVLKIIGLNFTVIIISSVLGAIFSWPSEVIQLAGYSNISALVLIPGVVLSSMATISIMGTAYAMLIDVRKLKDSKN